jgi:hypothetical protein
MCIPFLHRFCLDTFFVPVNTQRDMVGMRAKTCSDVHVECLKMVIDLNENWLFHAYRQACRRAAHAHKKGHKSMYYNSNVDKGKR